MTRCIELWIRQSVLHYTDCDLGELTIPVLVGEDGTLGVGDRVALGNAVSELLSIAVRQLVAWRHASVTSRSSGRWDHDLTGVTPSPPHRRMVL